MERVQVAKLQQMATDLALEPAVKAGGPSFRVTIGIGRYGFRESLDVTARHGAVWQKATVERVVTPTKAISLMRRKAVELDRLTPRGERLRQQAERRQSLLQARRAVSAQLVRDRDDRLTAVCTVCGRRNSLVRPQNLPDNQRQWFLRVAGRDDHGHYAYSCPDNQHLPQPDGATS